MPRVDPEIPGQREDLFPDALHQALEIPAGEIRAPDAAIHHGVPGKDEPAGFTDEHQAVRGMPRHMPQQEILPGDADAPQTLQRMRHRVILHGHILTGVHGHQFLQPVRRSARPPGVDLTPVLPGDPRRVGHMIKVPVREKQGGNARAFPAQPRGHAFRGIHHQDAVRKWKQIAVRGGKSAGKCADFIVHRLPHKVSESDGQPPSRNGESQRVRPPYLIVHSNQHGMNPSPASRTGLPFLRLPVLIAAFTGFGAPACSVAQDEKTNYSAVAHDVVKMLQETHYSNKDFEDELSRKAFRNFLDTLDYSRLYFTKPEIEAFRSKYETTLDDNIQLYKLDPAKEIFAAYSKHVTDRFAKIKALLESGKLDFNSNDTVQITRKDADWAATPEELDELWKKEIIREVLLERINVAHAEKRRKEKEAAGSTKDKGKEAAGNPKDSGKETAKTQKKTPDSPEVKVLKRHQRYLDTLKQTDEEDITNYLLSAIATAYDPHSEYLSAPEKDGFNIEMKKALIGIGAVLSSKDGAAEIKSVVPGGPADKSGNIKMGDMILGVAQGETGEMEDIEGLKLNRIVEKIRGAEKSVVRLKVQPVDDPTVTREIRIVREKVEMKDTLAKGELIEIGKPGETAQRIGWINLDSFYADMDNRGGRSATADVKRVLERLVEKEKISGLVLDLRGDGGGSLEEAIKLTSLFVKKGTPVVQQRDYHDMRSSRKTRDIPVYTGPMIVMTDRASASASEIFAAALKDTNRALIVGDESTFGKGTVQTLLDVRDHMAPFADKARAGSLKVTIAKFYRINGTTTQYDGVTPDVTLPSRYDAMEVGEKYLKFPLPKDEIKALTYEKADTVPPLSEEVIKILDERSTGRIKNNPDIAFILDYIARTKELLKKNAISLNEKTRLSEDAANEERNRVYKEDRKKRAQLANKDGDPYRVYPVTLENVNDEMLKLDSEVKKEEKKTLQQMLEEDDDTVTENEDTFPHGFDPAKLETIHILQDMVNMAAKSPAAQKTTVRRD